MKKIPKPQPIVVATICSECGLPWEDHGEAPTLADCVRLLKAQPRPVQWYPYYPTTPQWSYTISDITSTGGTTFNNGDNPPDLRAIA